MKQINYLSIQGNQAPSFWFKNQDAQNFRSLIESITLSSPLIISSIYRSDLFYCTEEDSSDLIIKTWCLLKGQLYTDQAKGRFIRATNKQDAFEFYFDTLFHLMLHPSHYDRYKRRLNEIRRLEPNNTILTELMQCDMHLADCYKKQEVQYKQLLDDKTGQEDRPLTREGFRILAKRRLKTLHYN